MAKGLSIHIGVNRVDPDHYSGWSGPLQACVADAEDLAAIAEGQGFDATILRTAKATRGAVISAISAAADTLEAGDILLVTYSGHGGQVPDYSGDEDDLRDETWCLYDGQLIDDELRVLWSEFPAGVRILVLSDSCHSGTVTRAILERALGGEGPDTAPVDVVGRYRDMPSKVALATYRTNKDHYDALSGGIPHPLPDVVARVRLISGCQDDQLSLDGTFNGLFTGTLLRVWDKGQFQGSYADFHAEIAARMPANQTPNHDAYGGDDPTFDEQRPFAI